MEVIRQAEFLTSEEKQRLFKWGENIFGVKTLNLSWRPKDVHFLLYSDGELMSHVGILKHVASVDGKTFMVGGVGGVVTIPEAKNKGYAHQLMEHTAKFLEHDWKVAAGLLFCFPRIVAYYQTLGWQEVRSPVLIEQPDGKIPSPLSVMVLPLCEEKWLDKKIELQSLPW